MPKNSATVYLIDASVYIFRAWFSLPDTMTGRDGQPLNAVYGFANFLGDLLRRRRPVEIAVAFDQSLANSYRNEIYPAYKANRAPAPEDLKPQFGACRELTTALGLVQLVHDRYEADDIIGTLAARARADGKKVIIVTRDKDLTQLLGPDDRYWDFAGDRWLERDTVPDVFGVRADQIADFLALAGDAVDNIPGVKGVGAKAAVALLNHFGDIDSIYADLEAVESVKVRGAKRIRKLLEEQREQAYMSRRLTEIPCDIDLPSEAEDLRWRGADADNIATFCDRWGIGDNMRRQLVQLHPDRVTPH